MKSNAAKSPSNDNQDRVSADYIRSLLETNDRAVERAMVVLYQNQTVDEQDSEVTQHSNGIGFNAFDAKPGTYYARWVLGGRKLTGKHLELARRLSYRYINQLVAAAKKKSHGEGICGKR